MPARKTSSTYKSYSGASYNWKNSGWKNTNTNTNTSARSNASKTAAYSSPASSKYPANSPRFKAAREECQWKIGSYNNVYSQFTGSGNKTIFSPTNANKWIKYVNTGGKVYKFSNTQFTNFFGNQWTWQTPTAVRQFLRKKFGAFVKDVARGNSNTWLVATTKNTTGKPFNNYNWASSF